MGDFEAIYNILAVIIIFICFLAMFAFGNKIINQKLKYNSNMGGNMIKNNLMRDLLRYGKIKADFEVKDNMGRLFRIRVFEYQEKKHFTVMVDGELLRCEEV